VHVHREQRPGLLTPIHPTGRGLANSARTLAPPKDHHIEVETSKAGPFKLAEDRWKTYVENPGTAEIFSGSTLTHTDWAPHNVLVATDRVRLIDWAWPTLGAAWTDPAHWIIRLIAAGHTAQQAQAYALRLPAFATADPAHIDLFAAANVRLWNEIEQLDAGARPWTITMAEAAREWFAYRDVEQE
jgi:hypothetical protein